MAAMQAEICKQIAAFQMEVAKLTETLKAQLSQENEKLAASLTERFEAANTKLREEFSVKLQHEIWGVPGKVDTLKRDAEHDIGNLTKSIGDLSEEMSTRVNAHIVQTRKELDKQGQEITTSSKVVLANIRKHKTETESTVANLRQAINQSREQVDGLLNSMSSEVRTDIQSVKHVNESEIMRINNAVSSLEAKITAGVAYKSRSAFLQTAVVRTTTVGQTESTMGTVGSESSVNGVNGAKVCNMSICSDGANVPNTSINSGNNNVSAGSGLYANNSDLSELTLPTFTDSTSQVPLHFIRDLDQYFSLKRTPDEPRLDLVFRAVKEPFAKQWLSSVFDKMKNYDEFKKAFTVLVGRLALEGPSIYTNVTQDQASRALTIISDIPIWQVH
jgi:hypothetical protein